MNRYKIIFLAFSLCILIVKWTEAQNEAESGTQKKPDVLKIVVTSLEIDDKALNMVYEIRNNSEDDIWILTGACFSTDDTYGMGVGAHISEDGRTLTIGISINVQSKVDYIVSPNGRFIRLGPGESQTESIFMEIPVHPAPRSRHIKQQGQGIQHATNLAIELSYYPGNLPERILKSLKPPENIIPGPSGPHMSPDTFSRMNERLISREDELLTPWGGYRGFNFESEQFLRTIVENVRIPYEETSERRVECERPDLTSCTKVKIKYQPSMLDYFFPFAFQRSLLSPEELEYLQSEATFVGEDEQEIKAIANDISEAGTRGTRYGALIERYRSSVDIVCYYDDKPPMSFFIYNDDTIRINGNILPCLEGFPSLKILTPQIQAIDLRMRCAANLKNQWYRLRFYNNLHEALRRNDLSIRNQMIYPTPSRWCDDILSPCPVWDGTRARKWGTEEHICPSAGEGKNHYAMNPNCEPNSPPDMVLLFETKAGWNQHGGPELFTFDNHDPKGGCVLLNDGTVKFIRTKEELHQLRWK